MLQGTHYAEGEGEVRPEKSTRLRSVLLTFLRRGLRSYLDLGRYDRFRARRRLCRTNGRRRLLLEAK